MIRLTFKVNRTTGNHVSTELIAKNLVVVATLIPENNTFTIVNIVSGEVVDQGSANTFKSLKIAVKHSLKSLGVVFGEEVRLRKQKEYSVTNENN